MTSEQELSDFHNMAVAKGKECLLAISTRGQNPSKAKTIKKLLEDWLEENKI